MEDTENAVTVDMTNATLDDAMNVAMQERFSMPLVVVAALRQAGKKATIRLLEMIEDDATFDKLNAQEKMKLIELLLDRAYGKSETASSSMKTAQALGQGKNDDHGKQLAEIEQRMEERSVGYAEFRKTGKHRETESIEQHKGDATSDVLSRMHERVVRFDKRRKDRAS